MTDLEKRTAQLRKRYGDYLTQREFSEAADISMKTAHQANKKGIVPYQKESNGKVKCYRIRVEDVALYIENKIADYRSEPIPEKVSMLDTILSTEPDMISVNQASRITGIHKNSIMKWIHNGYLRSFRWKRYFLISKEELIQYMSSSRFWRARTKAPQKKALRMTMDWLETKRGKEVKKDGNK